MATNNNFGSAFLSSYSTPRSKLQARVHQRADRTTPIRRKRSTSKLVDVGEGISMRDVRELQAQPAHTSTKHFAKQGISVREIIKATPWSVGRYK